MTPIPSAVSHARVMMVVLYFRFAAAYYYSTRICLE
jgi:hypothetical protein